MAQVMASQAKQDRLFADDFARYANGLASLSRKEVVAIAAVHRYTLIGRQENTVVFEDPNIQAMLDSVIPSMFETDDEFIAVCGAATRTGFIISSFDTNQFRFI